MHPNPAFRQEPADKNLAFARSRGFGTLCINASEGPLLAHIPFLLSPDNDFADIHLARSNAIARAIPAGIDPIAAVLSVQGPDAYISPDWYQTPDQVPTWNYVSVHLRGTICALPPETLAPMVNALSDLFEKRLLPKPVWKSTKMGEGVMDRMLRMILPFRFTVQSVEGTWKLNQNKTASARHGVIAALLAGAGGPGAAELARMMGDLPD